MYAKSGSVCNELVSHFAGMREDFGSWFLVLRWLNVAPLLPAASSDASGRPTRQGKKAGDAPTGLVTKRIPLTGRRAISTVGSRTASLNANDFQLECRVDSVTAIAASQIRRRENGPGIMPSSIPLNHRQIVKLRRIGPLVCQNARKLTGHAVDTHLRRVSSSWR